MFRASEESNLSGARQRIETKMTPQIPWWHPKIMTLANWNSKTVISGYDQQISPKNYRSRTFEMEGQEDKAEEINKQKMQKNDDGQSYANW